MSQSELRERMALSMETTGGVFWMLTDSGGNDVAATNPERPDSEIALPEEIWPISQAAVSPVRDETTGLPVGWRQTLANGKQVIRSTASMLHFRYPSSKGGVMGLAPMEVARRRAQQEHRAAIYQDSILRNGGDPGGIIIQKSAMRPEVRKRFERTMREKFNDGAQAGDTRVLYGDVEYHANPVTPKDMQYATLFEMNDAAISEVFRVPEALLMGGANYAEHKSQLRVFWTIKMLAVFARWEDAINVRLLPRLRGTRGANYHAKFDTSKVEALQGDLLEMAQAAKALRDLGVPLNQALRMAGIQTDPIPGGDEPLVPTTLTPLSSLLDEDEDADGDTPAGTSNDDDEVVVEDDEDSDSDESPESEEGDEERSKLDAEVRALSGKSVTERLRDGETRDAVKRVVAESLAKLGLRSPDGGAANGSGDTSGRAVAPTAAAKETPEEGYKRRRALMRNMERRREKSDARIAARARKWGRAQRAAQLAHLDKVANGRSKSAPAPTRRRWGMSRSQAEGLVDALGFDLCLTVENEKAIEQWCARNRRLATTRNLDDLITESLLVKAQLTKKELDSLIVAARAPKHWEAELRKLFRDAFRSAYDDGAAAVASELGAEALDFDRAAQDFISSKLIKVSEGVNSTNADLLRRALAKAFAESPTDSTGTIAERLREVLEPAKTASRDVYTSFHKRAKTIARTETGAIDSHVRQESFIASGVELHEWVAAGDDLERPTHDSIDGATVPVGESFELLQANGSIVEMKHPHDPSGPAHEVVNCRCGAFPVIE